ncbi:MAG: hypothetical protein ABWZ77_00385 [Naasia sp.]
MAELNCDHDDTVDLGGNAIDWTRVSAEFGEEAFCLACPCGSWVVESASGEILARSGGAGAPRLELSRAA